jgi:protein-disulfide isomerase
MPDDQIAEAAARPSLLQTLRTRIARFDWKDWTTLAFAAAALTAAVWLAVARTPAPAGSDQFDRAQRTAIQAVVRQYILDNPEIIPEAVNRLQEREVAKLLDSNRAEIETPFAGAWGGAKDGDVVLVEFFDYNCPYCRASHRDVERLLAEDEDLKVVYRDFPVLGAASTEAATASLAAARQGKYRAFYTGMFESAGRPTREKIIETVRTARLNEIQTARDMAAPAIQAEIKKNLDLGRALGINGTPTYVVGNRILSGAVGYEELKKAVAVARAE